MQTLAQDLAAECAKAYALMESSLSKLSSDLGVTPFGLAPKSKVSPCTLKVYTIYLCNNLCIMLRISISFLCYCEIVGFLSICTFRTTFSKPLSLVLINYLVIWLKQHCSKGRGDAFHKHFEFDALKKQYEPFAGKLANMQISFSYLFRKK